MVISIFLLFENVISILEGEPSDFNQFKLVVYVDQCENTDQRKPRQQTSKK